MDQEATKVISIGGSRLEDMLNGQGQNEETDLVQDGDDEQNQEPEKAVVSSEKQEEKQEEKEKEKEKEIEVEEDPSENMQEEYRIDTNTPNGNQSDDSGSENDDETNADPQNDYFKSSSAKVGDISDLEGQGLLSKDEWDKLKDEDDEFNPRPEKPSTSRLGKFTRIFAWLLIAQLCALAYVQFSQTDDDNSPSVPEQESIDFNSDINSEENDPYDGPTIEEEAKEEEKQEEKQEEQEEINQEPNGNNNEETIENQNDGNDDIGSDFATIEKSTTSQETFELQEQEELPLWKAPPGMVFSKKVRIVNVGLPKSGTSSFSSALHQSSITTEQNSHYTCHLGKRPPVQKAWREFLTSVGGKSYCTKRTRCGPLVAAAVKAGMGPLDLIGPDLRSFGQLDCQDLSHFYMPQFEYLKEMLEAYKPEDVVFVMTTRSDQGWVDSVDRWGILRQRLVHGLSGRTIAGHTFPILDVKEGKTEEEKEFIYKFKQIHEQQARELTKQYGFQLIELNLEHPDLLLGNFTGLVHDVLQSRIPINRIQYFWANKNKHKGAAHPRVKGYKLYKDAAASHKKHSKVPSQQVAPVSAEREKELEEMDKIVDQNEDAYFNDSDSEITNSSSSSSSSSSSPAAIINDEEEKEKEQVEEEQEQEEQVEEKEEEQEQVEEEQVEEEQVEQEQVEEEQVEEQEEENKEEEIEEEQEEQIEENKEAVP